MAIGVLEIRLLGGFTVRLDSQPITWFRSAKMRALLAYLATQPDQDHARALLATLLWGDLPDAAAKTNLRIELSNLKKLLSAHPALEISAGTVCFHSALAVIDVHEFSQTVTHFFALPVEAQAGDLRELATAIDLYQGEFLAGFSLDDTIEFDDWRISRQEQLHELMMLTLTTLQQRYAEQSRWSELASVARRQLALVPWTESAHRNLMQALAAQGQTQAALEQFAKCAKILREEFGVEPSLPTVEFAERLRNGRAAAQPTQHNLTRQLKAMVGRKREIAHLLALLRRENLVTILGIGGVGKSHLAQTVAQKVIQAYGDGVWFVPFGAIDAADAAPERIALAIAAAIGYTITDTQAPLAELVSRLADRQMLFILDNCEHLVVALESVLDVLLNQTSVQMLATSRLRLMIDGESLFPLEGLAPDEAFALFVERARRVVPTFAAEDDIVISKEVARICEQVAGLPLGIELAASWVEHYSVAEIGQQLAAITIEPKQADGLLSRHHTLNGVFEYSWRLLNTREQHILARLSVFRGGFDRAAATTVAECGLSELSVMIAHSLVQRISAGRYDLHPLIHEFAGGKLPDAEQAVLAQKHSHHYLGQLISIERWQRAARLRIDFENVRSAWQQAVNAGDAAMVQQAASQFCEFIGQFGLMSDGYALYQEAVGRFGSESAHNELVAHLLNEQWVFARTIYGLPAASDLLHRLLSVTSNQELLAETHLNLATGYAEEGDWERTDYHFDQVETLTQNAPNPSLYIIAVEGRVHINAIHFRGDYAAGLARLEELLNLLDTATTPIADEEELRSRVLQSVPTLAMRYGDYGMAVHYGRLNLARITDLAHQQQRVWILLDVALSEQFAGMYPEAIAHNQEALALAQEIGAQDDIGLLNANLCLTMRQSGELEKALAHGLKGAEVLKKLGITRQEGQARNRVGHTLLALGRHAEAYAAYGDALVVWERLQHPNRYEAVAGRAVAAIQLGKEDEAVMLVEEVLAFVASAGLVGVVEPARLLLNCESVLGALGQAERARQTLWQGETWIQTIAGRISDDEVRQIFLNRPDNQLLMSHIATFVA